MDIALAIERIMGVAHWTGAITEQTKENYERLNWKDEPRKPPEWDEIVEADKLNQEEALAKPDIPKIVSAITQVCLNASEDVQEKYEDYIFKGRDYLDRGNHAMVIRKFQGAMAIRDENDPEENQFWAEMMPLLQKLNLGA